MELRQPARDGQAEPAPLLLESFPVKLHMSADALELFRAHPSAFIADNEFAVSLIPSEGDCNGLARQGKLKGIIDQLLDQTAKVCAGNAGAAIRDLEVKIIDAIAHTRGAGGNIFDRLANLRDLRFAKFGGLCGIARSYLKLGIIQKVFNQSLEARRGIVNMARAFLDFTRRQGAVEQQGGEPHDAVQRSD